MALVTKQRLEIEDLTDDKFVEDGKYLVAELTRDIAIPDMDTVPAGTRGIIEFATPSKDKNAPSPYRKRTDDQYSSRYVLFMFPRAVTGEIIATRFFASRVISSTDVHPVGRVNLP